jgi:asparagine synthase (glutamine-hydrolysing)
MPDIVQNKGILPLVKRTPSSFLNRLFDYPGELGDAGKNRLIEFLKLLRLRSTVDQNRFIISLFSKNERASAYAPHFAEKLGRSEEQSFSKNTLNFNQMLELQFEHWLPDDILCKQDKITMANSLEGRVPFMDHKLVELISSFPASYKMSFSENKIVLRRHLARNGMKDVAKRRKVPFYIPIDQYLNSGPLSDMANELLSESSIKRRGLFAWEAIRRIREAAQGNSFIYGKQIFSLVMLELWHRIFIDRESGWV